MEILDDDIHVFKHDFANMINVIGGYIKAEDMEGLRKYFSYFQKDYNQALNHEIINPTNINDPGIYNLIALKYQKASELNINFNLEIFFDFKNLQMSIYDFSKILGIFLDNSIEAAKDCKEGQINLIFREVRKQNLQIITIENTFNEQNINMKKIFEKGVSGKNNHSGIGLWEVNKIVKKNKNIFLKTTKDDNFFKQQLEIYY